MATLGSPQTSAGIQSFYDAQTTGPKIDPRIFIVVVIVFTLVILVIDHIIVAG